MLFTDVCTVYNHYLNNGQDTWKRTVIHGVQWRHNKEVTSISGTVMTQTKVESLTFDMARNYGNDTYLSPKDFEALTDKNGYWTLDDKNGLDVVVFGIVSTAITRPKDLRVNNQYMGTVSEVSDNTNRTLLKNIKVVLK